MYPDIWMKKSVIFFEFSFYDMYEQMSYTRCNYGNEHAVALYVCLQGLKSNID